jgi:hypothetical protein
MDHQGGFAAGWADRWRPAVVPLTATGLVLLERALMDEMGSPLMLVRTLGDLGRPWTDPVASVLAVMALTGELVVGYVAVVLVLGSLCRLPGSVGRLAALLTSLVTRPWSGACSTCSSAARCSPRRPWPRHREHRPAIDGAPCTWPRRRRRMSAASSVPPRWGTWPGTALGQERSAGRWKPLNRPQRGPIPAGQRRHCRPGWGAGRPTRPPSTTARRARPEHRDTVVTRPGAEHAGPTTRRRAAERPGTSMRGAAPERLDIALRRAAPERPSTATGRVAPERPGTATSRAGPRRPDTATRGAAPR